MTVLGSPIYNVMPISGKNKTAVLNKLKKGCIKAGKCIYGPNHVFKTVSLPNVHEILYCKLLKLCLLNKENPSILYIL